jgi:hypothetical protein
VRKVSFLVALVTCLGAAAAVASAKRARPVNTKLATLHSTFLLLQHNRPAKPPLQTTRGSVTEDGLALSQAVVQKVGGGASLWLIPGTRETCLAFLNPVLSYARTSSSETCQDTPLVLKYGEYIFIYSGTHEYIFGVQPGNARTVTATTNDGQKTKVETRYGVYTLVSRRPKYIRTLSTLGGPTPVTTPPWH